MADTNKGSGNSAMDALIERAMKAEKEAADLKTQLEAKTAMKIDASVADYGKGTVSIRGINRWPISLFPAQIATVTEYLNSAEFKAFINSPDTVDKLRCGAFSAEFATRLGKEWPNDKKDKDYDTKVEAYKAAYNQGYALAKADSTLVSSGKLKKSSADKTPVVR